MFRILYVKVSEPNFNPRNCNQDLIGTPYTLHQGKIAKFKFRLSLDSYKSSNDSLYNRNLNLNLKIKII